jgi:uncharacterized membrane protein
VTSLRANTISEPGAEPDPGEENAAVDKEQSSGGSEREGPRDYEGVPRWPAAVALLAIGAIYATLSERLTVGPPALLLGLVAVLLVPLMSAHRRGNHRLARWLALGLTTLVTLAVAASVLFLLTLLPARGTSASALLVDAALIWVSNVATFALWYWEIDGGGPARRRRHAHASKDFLFPQMDPDNATSSGWSPGFVDYLFLAFNTSTAFSPTDTAVLSRRAKVLMMAQSLLSLLVVAVLAARAINTL